MRAAAVGPGAACVRPLLPLLLLLLALTSRTLWASPLDPEVFLEKYGYLHEDEHIHNAVEMQTALREFQWLSRLPVTGRLDSATLRRMAEPRCGVSDEGSHQVWAERIDAVFTGKRAALRENRRRKRSSTPGTGLPQTDMTALFGLVWRGNLVMRLVLWEGPSL
uniref:Peptidoglycan binding-like domain-containing protein n=1 Tax=Knipowitschia caucasica TaxID=637954 RepID=A0AAV2J628_KNICA